MQRFPTVTDDPSPLPYLAAVLRDRSKIVLSIAISTVAATFLLVSVMPTGYSAAAEVVFEPLPSDSSVDLEAQAEYISVSSEVANAVAESADVGLSGSEILDSIEAEPTAVNILQLTASADDAETAIKIANTTASTYLGLYQRTKLQPLRRTISSLRDRVERVQAQLKRTSPSGRGGGGLNKRFLLRRESALKSKIDDAATELEVQGGKGQVVSAQSAEADVSSLARSLPLAAVIGLLLGCAVAFLVARLDPRMRDRDEIERRLNLPVLGSLPRIRSLKKAGDELLIPIPPALEKVATEVAVALLNSKMRSAVLTGPSGGEGTTTIARYVARAAGQSGQRVLLVSADLRSSGHPEGSVPGGLAGLLQGAAGVDEAIEATESNNLYFLPAGDNPREPAPLLASETMKGLLAQLREQFDLILMDSPPVLRHADAAVLATHTDTALLVLNAEHTETAEAINALKELVTAGARVAGCVLNYRSVTPPPHHHTQIYQSTETT